MMMFRNQGPVNETGGGESFTTARAIQSDSGAIQSIACHPNLVPPCGNQPIWACSPGCDGCDISGVAVGAIAINIGTA